MVSSFFSFLSFLLQSQAAESGHWKKYGFITFLLERAPLSCYLPEWQLQQTSGSDLSSPLHLKTTHLLFPRPVSTCSQGVSAPGTQSFPASLLTRFMTLSGQFLGDVGDKEQQREEKWIKLQRIRASPFQHKWDLLVNHVCSSLEKKHISIYFIFKNYCVLSIINLEIIVSKFYISSLNSVEETDFAVLGGHLSLNAQFNSINHNKFHSNKTHTHRGAHMSDK